MTMDWLGRAKLRRIATLEQEVALLRGMIADQPPPKDPRVDGMVSTVAEIGRRMAAVEDLAAESAAIITKQGAATLSEVERAHVDRTAIAELRVALIRLERELARHEGETSKIATGLLERIHRYRPSGENGKLPRDPS